MKSASKNLKSATSKYSSQPSQIDCCFPKVLKACVASSFSPGHASWNTSTGKLVLGHFGSPDGAPSQWVLWARSPARTGCSMKHPQLGSASSPSASIIVPWRTWIWTDKSTCRRPSAVEYGSNWNRSTEAYTTWNSWSSSFCLNICRASALACDIHQELPFRWFFVCCWWNGFWFQNILRCFLSVCSRGTCCESGCWSADYSLDPVSSSTFSRTVSCLLGIWESTLRIETWIGQNPTIETSWFSLLPAACSSLRSESASMLAFIPWLVRLMFPSWTAFHGSSRSLRGSIYS